MKLTEIIKYPLTSLLDLVYPPICPVTNYILKDNESIISNSIYFKFDIAGDPFEIKNNKVDDYISNNFYFDKIYSLFSNFEESQKIVHLIKYKKYYWIAETIGEELGKKITKESDCKYDIILPCPLHKVKKRTRGFNQAYHIALGINNKLNTEIIEDLVLRHKFTQTQTKLKSKERKKNLENVFKINTNFEQDIENKSILIVDDVITTGATINSIAKELSNFNPKLIDCATITMA